MRVCKSLIVLVYACLNSCASWLYELSMALYSSKLYIVRFVGAFFISMLSIRFLSFLSIPIYYFYFYNLNSAYVYASSYSYSKTSYLLIAKQRLPTFHEIQIAKTNRHSDKIPISLIANTYSNIHIFINTYLKNEASNFVNSFDSLCIHNTRW